MVHKRLCSLNPGVTIPWSELEAEDPGVLLVYEHETCNTAYGPISPLPDYQACMAVSPHADDVTRTIRQRVYGAPKDYYRQ